MRLAELEDAGIVSLLECGDAIANGTVDWRASRQIARSWSSNTVALSVSISTLKAAGVRLGPMRMR